MAIRLENESQRLARARAELAQSEKLRLLGQFLGHVVHDLNNVFTVLQSALDIARRRVDLSRSQQGIVSSADVALSHGNELMRQLLAFSRHDDDAPGIVDIGSVVRGSNDLLRFLAGGATRFDIRLAPDLWPITARASQLQSVLFNLAANARDAMPAGGVLTLTAQNCFATERPPWLPDGDYVRLSVTDTGTGMPPEVLSQLGEPFFTTKPEGRGTGLGIASAFDFARDCGGDVKIVSTPGHGTTVALYLGRAAMTAAQRPASPGGSGVAARPHGAAAILLVCGTPNTRAYLGAVLRSLGYTLVEADTCDVARGLVKAGRKIDLAIIDLDIERGGGWQLALDLHSAHPELATIFLGYGNASASGGALVFRQPFSESLFTRAVLEQLGRLDSRISTTESVRPADRLRDRLRQPGFRAVYDAWRELAGEAGTLPPAHQVDHLAGHLPDDSFLVAVESGPVANEFRVLVAGRALVRLLGRELAGEVVTSSSDDVLGSIQRAYVRCLCGVPHFDYARLGMGEGRMLLMERLVLPLSDDGECVTHLFGVATFNEIPI